MTPLSESAARSAYIDYVEARIAHCERAGANVDKWRQMLQDALEMEPKE